MLKYFIRCPSCRKPSQLPDVGVTDLPNAFLINSLLDVQVKLKRQSSHEVNCNMECEVHHDLLRVYCETCEQLICRDCTVSQPHLNHKYELVVECYQGHCQEIETNLTTVKKKVADINAAMTTCPHWNVILCKFIMTYVNTDFLES